MTTPLSALTQLSAPFSNDLSMVQAAGGNASFKTSPKRMWVKASGIRLKDLKPSLGWVHTNPEQIRNGFLQIRKAPVISHEVDYANLLNPTDPSTQLRASMEAGLHAILPSRIVFHLHSVSGVLLGMMTTSQARSVLKQWKLASLPVVFVPPMSPGYHLANHLLRETKKLRPCLGNVRLWVLRNHGVLWEGSTVRTIQQSIRQFERVAQSFFDLPHYPPPHRTGTKDCQLKNKKTTVFEICFCQWPEFKFDLRPLFPDFVIYFNVRNGRAVNVTQTGDRQIVLHPHQRYTQDDLYEIFYAHALMTTLASLRGQLKPLPRSHIRALQTMETERRRIQQMAR